MENYNKTDPAEVRLDALFIHTFTHVQWKTYPDQRKSKCMAEDGKEIFYGRFRRLQST